MWSVPLLRWEIGRTYSKGDRVQDRGKVYEAVDTFVANSNDLKPAYGEFWGLYWKLIGPAPEKK